MVIVLLFFNNFYFSNLIHILQYVYVHNNNILAIEYVNKRNVQMLEKLMQQTKQNKVDAATA